MTYNSNNRKTWFLSSKPKKLYFVLNSKITENNYSHKFSLVKK